MFAHKSIHSFLRLLEVAHYNVLLIMLIWKIMFFWCINMVKENISQESLKESHAIASRLNEVSWYAEGKKYLEQRLKNGRPDSITFI